MVRLVDCAVAIFVAMSSFQFLHGAIGGALKTILLYTVFLHFNSYMVRLVEGELGNVPAYFTPISIPTWCDWWI